MRRRIEPFSTASTMPATGLPLPTLVKKDMALKSSIEGTGASEAAIASESCSIEWITSSAAKLMLMSLSEEASIG